MLLLLISVCLINHIVSPVYGLINIESKPAKIAYDDFVKLVCDVGTMKDTVKWVYRGVTYFSCDPPYTNCYTNFRITNPGYYDFSIKDDSLIMILIVRLNTNDGIWFCNHGNERANFKMDVKDKAVVKSFGISNTGNPRVYEFQCIVQSQIPVYVMQIPVDVMIYAVSYQGKRILYDVQQSSLSNHTVTTSLLCSERYIYCDVTNGYGPTYSRSESKSVECPLKILHDLISSTTLVINNTDSNQVNIYYEGYPPPSTSVYRIGADDIPEISQGITTSFNYPTRTEPALAYVRIYIFDLVKAGKYILILKQGDIKEVIYIDVIYSTPQTTTTLPIGTSTNDTRGTAEETNTVEYLGVAGFVMSLVLVLILVIVGVFWFIRIKQKPAGSVDQNKTPRKEPNQMYENMKKF